MSTYVPTLPPPAHHPQLALPLPNLVEPDYAPDATLQQRFEAWLAANPWVVPTVERLVQRLVDAGRTRVGIKQVWEVLRYEYGATTGDEFRANNSWTSRMARLLIELHPEWEPLIETRALRAA